MLITVKDQEQNQGFDGPLIKVKEEKEWLLNGYFGTLNRWERPKGERQDFSVGKDKEDRQRSLR